MRNIVQFRGIRLPKFDHEALAGHARRWAVRLGGVAIVVLASSPTLAFAQAGADPTGILQKILDFIIGKFGQTLAVLGIIGIGVSWMFGRASMGVVAGVIGGIVIVFGASFIGSTITAG